MTIHLERFVSGTYERATMSMDDYQGLAGALRGVKTLVVIEERFNLVLGNFLDFERALLNISLERALFMSTDVNLLTDSYYEVNRFILNLLAAGRLYLDHVPHQLTHFPDSVIGAAEAFESARRKQYDTRLGYRLLDALRNYVQHREFPAHIVSMDSHVDSHAREHRILYTVTPYVVVARLREDPKFKAAVLRELDRLGRGKVDLKPLIREYVAGIGHVHSAIRSLLVVQQTEWTMRIDAAIRALTGHGRDDAGVIRLVGETPDGEALESYEVFRGDCERIRWLQDRNADPVFFEKLAVTSASQETS